MKHILVFIFLSITMFAKAQTAKSFLVDKTFSSNVGSICEETNVPDPCAGKMIYLILDFNKETVLVKEKYVSSCNQVSFIEIGNFNWIIQNRKVILDYKKEDVQYTSLENLELRLEGEQLKGTQIHWNKNISHYEFTNE